MRYDWDRIHTRSSYIFWSMLLKIIFLTRWVLLPLRTTLNMNPVIYFLKTNTWSDLLETFHKIAKGGLSEGEGIFVQIYVQHDMMDCLQLAPHFIHLLKPLLWLWQLKHFADQKLKNLKKYCGIIETTCLYLGPWYSTQEAYKKTWLERDKCRERDAWRGKDDKT